MQNLLLADNHLLFRECLALTLANYFPLNSVVVSQANNWQEAQRFVEQIEFDLLLLNLKMPGAQNWQKELGQIINQQPKIRICVVSDADIRSDIQLAFELGTKGYVSKQSSLAEMKYAIEVILAGKNYIPKSIWQYTAGTNGDHISILTARQHEVLSLSEQGLSNKEIAKRIGLAENTIKRHFYNIFRALGVKNRVEAIRSARLHGWLE